MKTKTFLFVLINLIIIEISYCQKFYNVLDFGAKNDGVRKNTMAIYKAISEASKNGGGTVYFPAGVYLTGPIHLKSNITLFIEAGAILKFSDDFDDYLPMVQSRYEGNDIINFSPLIYAYEAENIAIIGRGTLDGQGKKWWDFFLNLYRNPPDSLNKWQKEFKRLNNDIIWPEDRKILELGFCRPPFIQPMYCKNILIEGIKIINSPFWTVNPEFCENVTVNAVSIINPPSPNTDGINPESCKNVHISNCHISVGDDCITIKSGRDEAGRKKGMAAENYTITNCTMLSGHGGVVIGSEMSGGVKKIAISNCIFDGTDRGIRIKSSRGRGGVVEDIRVSNIIVKNLKYEAVTLNLLYSKSMPEEVSEKTPLFKNIHISNISGTAKQACSIFGLEEMPVNDISFSDINLETQKGFTLNYSTNITLNNIILNVDKGPAISIDNSKQIEINGIRNLTPSTESPIAELINTQNVLIHNCFQMTETDLFLKVDGEFSRDIFVENNNFNFVKTIYYKSDIVPDNAVKIK
jgi:polygalacturonase